MKQFGALNKMFIQSNSYKLSLWMNITFNYINVLVVRHTLPQHSHTHPMLFVCRVNKPERFRACLQHFLSAADDGGSDFTGSEDDDDDDDDNSAAAAAAAVVDDVYNETNESSDDDDDDDDVTPDEEEKTPDEDEETPDEDEDVVIALPLWEVCVCVGVGVGGCV